MSTIRRKLKTDELLYFTQSLNEDWTDPEIQGNTTPVYAKEILNNFVTQKINNRLLGFKQDEFEIHYIFENKQFIIESEELDFKDVYTSNSDLAARAESAFDKFLQTVSKYSPDASEKLVQKIENIIESCHFKIDLSEKFGGWDNTMENIRKLIPLNKIIINHTLGS